jgi:hypothetical protein
MERRSIDARQASNPGRLGRHKSTIGLAPDRAPDCPCGPSQVWTGLTTSKIRTARCSLHFVAQSDSDDSCPSTTSARTARHYHANLYVPLIGPAKCLFHGTARFSRQPRLPCASQPGSTVGSTKQKPTPRCTAACFALDRLSPKHQSLVQPQTMLHRLPCCLAAES